jgi:hypothetical protein
MEFSSVANLFPLMSDEEFAALKDDIRQHGQHEPIWTYEGKIIDGRNRYRACSELGIEPITQDWDGDGSIVDFVVSCNLHRRHLNSGQKAVLSLAIEKHLAREAKARQGTRTDIGQKIDGSSGRADEQAAALVGTNRQYVSDAKAIQMRAPALLPLVRNGELTIQDAKALSDWSEESRVKIIAEMRSGKPIQEAVKPVKAAARQARKERNEAKETFSENFNKAALGDDYPHTRWSYALGRAHAAIRKAPEVDDVSQITQRWKIETKHVRLRWIRAMQAKLEKFAVVLEEEIAGHDGFNEAEIENYFRKEMDDFNPDDF